MVKKVTIIVKNAFIKKQEPRILITKKNKQFKLVGIDICDEIIIH